MESVTKAARGGVAAYHAGRTLAGIALIVTAVMGFAILDAIAKALSDHLGPIQIAWARFAFLFLTVAILTRGRDVLPSVRSMRPIMLARAALPCAAGLLGVWAIGLMPLSIFTAVIFASPLMVTALSGPLLGERPGLHHWLAVVVGFAGILVVARPWESRPEGDFAIGFLAALAMSLVYALYQMLNRKLSGRDRPRLTLTQIGLVGAVIVSAAVPFDWTAPNAWQWALLVASGVIHAGVQLCLIRAFALAPASTLAPFNYVQIIAAVAFGVVIFGEAIDLETVLGGAIVVASGLYILQRERHGA